MNTYGEIMRRIQAVTRTRTQEQLAYLLKIKQSSVSDAKRRGRIPAEWYLKLFEMLGANPDWLKNGAGPVYLRTEAGYAPSDDADLRLDPALSVPPLSRPAFATVYGLWEDSASKQAPDSTPDPASGIRARLSPVGRMALPQSHAPAHILVATTGDDACAPLARRGAYVGIDTRPPSLAGGDVYAVFLPGQGPGLRRIYWDQAAENFALRAENPLFPETRLTRNEFRERLFGRLTWVLQDV